MLKILNLFWYMKLHIHSVSGHFSISMFSHSPQTLNFYWRRFLDPKSSYVLSFCTNSSTFPSSVVTNLFTVSEVAWLLSVVHLCRHCHLCSWEIRATGQEGFSYCRAAAFWCQRHHLTQSPSCLFSVCVTILFVHFAGRTSGICCLLHRLQFLLLLPQSWTILII